MTAMNPEELRQTLHRLHQLELTETLRTGLQVCDSFQDDWASWNEFVGGLIVELTKCDKDVGDMLGLLCYLDGGFGKEVNPIIRELCWKVVTSAESDWPLSDLASALKAAT